MNLRNVLLSGVCVLSTNVAGVTMAERASGSESLPLLVDPRASEVAAMERAFCNSVFALGIRDGFLRHFSPDGILFRPGPVVCHEVYPTRPKSPASLLWTPELADISSAGDLGYTFGPWELRPAGLEDTTFANGTYVTLWRREPDGTWKITLDWGIGHELEPAKATLLANAIAEVRSEFAARGIYASSPVDEQAADATSKQESAATSKQTPMTDLSGDSAALLDAERTIRAGSVAASGIHDPTASAPIAKDCRFLRADHPPLIGVDALRSTLGDHVTQSISTPKHAFVSRSMDLGYVYGSYTATPAGATAAAEQIGDQSANPGGVPSNEQATGESGYFLRIWKKHEGQWQVVLEMIAAG